MSPNASTGPRLVAERFRHRRWVKLTNVIAAIREGVLVSPEAAPPRHYDEIVYEQGTGHVVKSTLRRGA
jgi:hypothetical protein